MSHKVVCNASLINKSAVERWERWQIGAVHAYSVPESSDQLQEHPGSEQQDTPDEEGFIFCIQVPERPPWPLLLPEPTLMSKVHWKPHGSP